MPSLDLIRQLTRPLAHDRFPEQGIDLELAAGMLKEELLLDGNSKQNLATFCQTYQSRWALELMELGVDRNLIDKDEYPQTAAIEERCVHLLADLWHAPAPTVGCSTIGSSEAAMLGGLAAKWRWRQRRQAAGLPADRPNLVCGSVQICWKKFARYWDVELREVEMAPGELCLTPERMLERVDENTIAVVPTLGVTYHGLYEDVDALARALDDLQGRTGLDVPIHVDGASGAFVAPFCAPDLPAWDFRQPRVKSINASGHKFGLAPLGVGWVLWREAADLPEELVFHVSYLGGDMPTFQINFSRPAGQVLVQYHLFTSLGREGYAAMHGSSYANARHFADRLRQLGPFELVNDADPSAGIPTVVWRLPQGSDPGFNLYDLAERLRLRGWQVPAYPFTGSYADTAFQRILVKRDFTREMADLLLADIAAALEHFRSHPIHTRLTAEEAASYNHL
jgi:glutamate decarboxylase